MFYVRLRNIYSSELVLDLSFFTNLKQKTRRDRTVRNSMQQDCNTNLSNSGFLAFIQVPNLRVKHNLNYRGFFWLTNTVEQVICRPINHSTRLPIGHTQGLYDVILLFVLFVLSHYQDKQNGFVASYI